MKKKVILFLPLVILFGICVFLMMGLKQDPKKIASALIGKPVPEFFQGNLLESDKVASNKSFPQEPFLLNVWGSWCYYCKEEHPLLMNIAKSGVQIVGLNYRDKAQSAVEMLQKMGNPFTLVIDDSQGKLAMQLGVDGAPETYVIDGNGVIRYRYSGAIDQKAWEQVVKPELEKLK